MRVITGHKLEFGY